VADGPARAGVDEIWRYLAMCAVTACASLILGQFLPNRNIVTTDQLNAATARLQDGQNSQAQQIANLSQQVATLTGELQMQNRLHK
jgi:TolA-binding protein